MPERCFAFPPSLAQVFNDVDLIFHAGDVGELWVLDQLSEFAPVFAVQGNDDTEDAQRELPLQQVITIGGRRILLWHSHYPDRIDEQTSRTDPLRPKLTRIAQHAKRAGATVAIFGHWHLPLVYEQDGVLLINPGTLELGNAAIRQLIQTVALLELHADGRVQVTHVDLARPQEVFVPQIDFDAGFRAAMAQFTRDMRAPALQADSPRLWAALNEILPESARKAFFQALNRAAHPFWLDQQQGITHQEWIAAVQAADELPTEVRQRLMDAIAGRPSK